MSHVGLKVQFDTSYRSLDDNGSNRSIQSTESSRNSALNRYIIDDIIDCSPVLETKCHKITRIGLLSIAIIVGMIGNLTFIPISGGPAENDDGTFNEPYRWTLITSNTIGFGILTTWILLKLVNESMKPRSHAEQEISKPTISKCTSVMTKTAAITCGLASQIPLAFMAYAYNDNSIPYAVVVVASNASYPIYSLDLSFKSALQKRNFTDFEKKLHFMKLELIKNLYQKKDEFLSMTLDQKESFVEKVKEIQGKKDDREKLQVFFNLLFANNAPILSNDAPLLIKGGRVVSKAAGLFLSSMVLSHYWMGGYEGTKVITDAEAATQSVAAFVTGCNAYLTIETVINSVVSMFDTSVEVGSRKYRLPFSVQLMPKTATISKMLGLGIAATCWGATVQFSRDYFDGSFEPVVEYGASIANASIIHYAMQATIDEAITTYAAHYGKGREQDFAKIVTGIDNVINKINESSMQNFAAGLKSWLELFDAPPFACNITVENLNGYLCEKEDTQLVSTA
ncbi:MAG: hypothetical protein HKM07_04220 [Chlamydiae bacterium]|nr:hypothetical protein [Chlamydiota bacterium]